MYLGHHYVVDLVGGGAYAVIAFWIGSFFLPHVLPTPEQEQFYSQNKVVHDLGDAMDKREKQNLFQSEEDDEEAEVGSSSSGGSHSSRVMETVWELGQDEDDEEMDPNMSFAQGVDVMELSRVVVNIPSTLAGLEIEEVRNTRSEPSSPTGSHHSSSSVSSSATVSSWSAGRKSKRMTAPAAGYRQSWSGWQGYESWIEVLATVNSPRTSPKASPKSSPAPTPRHSTE